MFGTIRRHQSWLWIVIIVLVIISFVWYMGPGGSSPGAAGGSGIYGYVNGEPIGRDQFMQAYTEARLRFFMMMGSWPEESQQARMMFDAENEVARRLVMLDKLESLDVWVDDAEVAQWLAPLFADPQTGRFQPQMYRQFLETALPRGQVSEEAFKQFARHQVGIQHLMEAGAVSGALVSPREAEVAFRRENESVKVKLVSFSYTNQVDNVVVEDEALEAFYNKEAARWRIPDKVSVNYVKFAASNYVAEAEAQLVSSTNLSTQLEAMYLQRGTNSFLGTNGVVMSAEAAKQQLRGELVDQVALSLAYKASTGFGEQLLLAYEEAPEQKDHLERLAEGQAVEHGTTEPFARLTPPLELGVGQEFGTAAFALSEVQPMTMEPVVSRDGVYLLTLKERVAGHVPPLELFRNQVLIDFKNAEARRLAREAAAGFLETAKAGIAASKDFDTICAEAGLQVISPEAFSQGTTSLVGLPSGVNFRQIQPLALELAAGQLSDVEQTADGGVVMYGVSREPVSEDRVKTELAGYMEELRNTQRNQAVSEWSRKEMELAQVNSLPDLSNGQ